MWHIAVLWGLDGTLVDNDKALYDRLKWVAGKHGVSFSRSDFFSEHSFSMPDETGFLAPAQSTLHAASDKALYYWMAARNPRFADKVTPLEWISELGRAYEKFSAQTSVRAQALALMRALKAEGVVQGLVSNAAPCTAQAALRSLGLTEAALDFIVYSDQFCRPKPYAYAHSAARDLALEHLARRHGEDCRPMVMAVENSSNGVQGALAAGLSTVQYLLPGQVPLAPKPGCPEFRAVRDMRALAEILVTLGGS